MSLSTKPRRSLRPLAIIITIIALVAIAGYLGYDTTSKTAKIDMLLAERNFFLLENASSTAAYEAQLDIASSTIRELSSRLELTEEELSDIEDDLSDEKNRNEEFEDQINDIVGTVGVLDKLSKTDKELLQKYSKVYFLNEHYIPEKIVEIEKKYLYNETIAKSIHGQVEPYLYDMIDDAAEDEIKIWVVSSYRSFSEQTQLKGAYTQTYGSGANTFSADQGYSEHQLGTTLDFTTEGLGGRLDGFESTEAYTWMLKNAHRYGFTLSYPKGNAYYTFEPWHWRFVGEDLASDLYKDDASFYDWEQREIDAYLIKIFD